MFNRIFNLILALAVALFFIAGGILLAIFCVVIGVVQIFSSRLATVIKKDGFTAIKNFGCSLDPGEDEMSKAVKKAEDNDRRTNGEDTNKSS